MISNLRVWLALVIVLGACDSGSETPAPGTPVTGAPTPGVIAPGMPGPAPPPMPGVTGDARAALITAWHLTQTRKMRTRATMNVTDGPMPGTSTWVGEFVPPDTRRMDMTMPSGQRMQMVASGTQAWMRHGETGGYRPLPGVGAMMAEIHRDVLAGLEAGSGTTELGGTEIVDGRPMTVYRFSTTTPPRPPVAEASTVTGRGWIGADGLVHKFEADVARPAARITMTYEYDESIAITIPPT